MIHARAWRATQTVRPHDARRHTPHGARWRRTMRTKGNGCGVMVHIREVGGSSPSSPISDYHASTPHAPRREITVKTPVILRILPHIQIIT